MEADLKIPQEYHGKFVAQKFPGGFIIASGDDPYKVANEAKEMGYDEPVVFYVPKPDEEFVYSQVA